jgi:hypothetical protein
MALASGAQAAVVFVKNNNGVLTGVDGLVVDGSTYDVTFEADTGQNPPTPFFTSVTMATDAATALKGPLSFHDDPDIIGCPSGIDYLCQIITPAPSVFGVELSVDTQSFPVDFVHTISGQPNPANEPFPAGANYAIWTSAEVAAPEPPPLALLGIGMAGVAAARTVRRKKPG